MLPTGVAFLGSLFFLSIWENNCTPSFYLIWCCRENCWQIWEWRSKYSKFCKYNFHRGFSPWFILNHRLNFVFKKKLWLMENVKKPPTLTLFRINLRYYHRCSVPNRCVNIYMLCWQLISCTWSHLAGRLAEGCMLTVTLYSAEVVTYSPYSESINQNVQTHKREKRGSYRKKCILDIARPNVCCLTIELSV